MTSFTHYILDGTKVVAQYQTSTSSVTPSNIIYFYYDESGSPTGIKYNGNVYFFQKNLQGDIIRILNSSGTIVATYTYDAWGNIIASTDTSGVSIGTKNPFRYRGYYHDTETGLYYLNSRYYDPQVGRFISADSSDVLYASPKEFTDKNLFAYCDNNPITRADNGGDFWHIIAGGVIGGVVSGAVEALTQIREGQELNWKKILISSATGAVSGAFAATGLGVAGQFAVNAIASGVESYVKDGIDNGFDSVDLKSVAKDAVIGGLSNMGNGVGKGTAKHLMTMGKKATKRIINNFSIKTIKKTAKYYFSQTSKLYFKPLIDDALETINDELEKTYNAVVRNRS